MNFFKRYRRAIMILGGAVSVMLSPLGYAAMPGKVMAAAAATTQTLAQYTALCETELKTNANSPAINITGFDCQAGTELPNQRFGTACDSQALLGGPSCRPGSRLGRITFSDANVMAIWTCRKYASDTGITATDNKYTDVNMIINNRATGKTCFFQSKYSDGVPDGPIIPSPKTANQAVWLQPSETAGVSCTGCHANDAFIVSPHVVDALSKYSFFTGAAPKGSYSVVGPDFVSMNANINRTNPAGGNCAGSCHYLSTSSRFSSFINDSATKGWMPASSSSPFVAFVPASDKLYLSRSDGTYMFNGTVCSNGACNGWTKIMNRYTALAAAGNKLYSINGDVYQQVGENCGYNNCGWKKIGNRGGSFAPTASSSHFVHSDMGGGVWRYKDIPCDGSNAETCNGWEQIDNGGGAVLTAGTRIFHQKFDRLYIYKNQPCNVGTGVCSGWDLVDDKVDVGGFYPEKYAASGNNTLYAIRRLTNGSIGVWKHIAQETCNASSCDSDWTQIDNNTNASILYAGGTNLYQKRSDNSLWKYNGTSGCANGVCSGWQKIDNDANAWSFTAASSTIYKSKIDGSVWRFTGTACSGNTCAGWQQIGNPGGDATLTVSQ